LAASQTVFNGFGTASRTRQAEHQVSGSRETLRATEQAVLLAGATAYMNLLDVLNAEQALVQARTALVTAQHDRIVASYTLLAAVGSLSAQVLGLAVSPYDPNVHYQQVRDSWLGVRTPDGR
jgi:outer membrane protein